MNADTSAKVNRDSINRLRKQCNLRLITSGYKKCIECKEEFYAEDMSAEYYCDKHKKNFKGDVSYFAVRLTK